MDPNYYFYCKCSICFDNDSDLELVNCGDQYCLGCLERYVDYWIRESSWGLQAAALNCPVCGVEMEEDDWIPYVSSGILNTWESFQLRRQGRFADPYAVSRQCPHCNNLQSCMGRIWEPLDEFTLNLKYEELRKELKSLLPEASIPVANDIPEFRSYLHWVRDQNPRFIELFLRLSRLFLHLLSREEDVDKSLLITLQLEVQHAMPFGWCEACEGKFCLFCEAPGWFHPHGSHEPSGFGLCELGLISKNGQCPRCFILINKEPEGCNQMLCSYCGLKFCWQCGREWSRECGIYECNQSAKKMELGLDSMEEIGSLDEFADAIDFDSDSPAESDQEPVDPEIGVPNIREIREKTHKRMLF